MLTLMWVAPGSSMSPSKKGALKTGLRGCNSRRMGFLWHQAMGVGGHSEVAPVAAVEVVELAQVALGDEPGGVLGEGEVGVGGGVQMDLRQARVEDGADLASGVGAGGAGHSGADDGDR